MRRSHYLVVILLLIAQTSFGQIYQNMAQPGYKFSRARFDSVLSIPMGLGNLKNISGGQDTGQIRFNKSDSSVYVWNGRDWIKAGSVTDTASLSNRINLKVNISDTSAMLANYAKTAAVALKLNISDTATMLTNYAKTAAVNLKLNISDTATMLSNYAKTSAVNLKLNIADTASMLSAYARSAAVTSSLALKLNISDTATMLAPYSRVTVTSYGKNATADSTILLLSNGTRYAAKDSVGAGGSNIYTADGSLSSARTLTLNSQPLTIAGTTSSRFFANGNVGIGTTTDGGYKLNVLGTARVQGTDFVLTGSTGSSNSVRTSVTNTDAQGAADFFYFNSTGNFFGGQMYGTGYAGTTANVTNNNLAKFITNASNFVIGTQAVSPIIFSVNTSAFAGEVARFSTGNNLLVGTTTDVASSKLTITSTTQGVLFPRMTTTQRNAISSPAEGLNVYNTTLSTNDVKTSAAWYQQPNGLSGSGTLDFASTSAFNSSDLTVTITGAAVGDIVMLGTPVQDANSTFTAFVSATNTVTIRMNNYSALAINPASGTFKVYVIKN